MSEINVLTLQNSLIDNSDNIILVMSHLGFDVDKIKYKPSQHLISSPRPDKDADNPNGFLLYTNSLQYMYTTRSGSGNIYSLVMDIKNCSFPDALNMIAKWIGVKDISLHVTPPFGGFYKGICRTDGTVNALSQRIYSESDLPPADSLSLSFIRDGIAPKVQEQWGVRYDHVEDAVLIPIYNTENKLVGCKARSNDPNVDFGHRWYAYLPYTKTGVVYGWCHNYRSITDKQIAVIFESEKSVLQCTSFGCNLALAIGGHNISKTQAQYIQSLMVKKIIIAFDEDVQKDPDQLRLEANKLVVKNKLYGSQIGFICDYKNNLLPKGSKASPSDFGRDVFGKLIKNNVIWIN